MDWELTAPKVFFLSLALPGIHRDAGSGDGSGSLVLGRENVAGGPRDLSTKSGESLDEDGSLDGHVQASSNTGAFERLLSAVLLAQVHQPWHFILGDLNLFSAPGREPAQENKSACCKNVMQGD